MADRPTPTACEAENAAQGLDPETAGPGGKANDPAPEKTNIRLRKEAPTITVHVSQKNYDRIHQLAYRTGGSVSQVTHLAILRLIDDAEKGVIPLLPEFRTGIEPGHA